MDTAGTIEVRRSRVADISPTFWIIKALSTAFGEAASDYLVHAMAPELAVLLGFAAFCAALALQLRQGRYIPWIYWLSVVMVGVFGTMAADVLHVAFHVPYAASAVLYGAALAGVFVAWQRVEGTVSIHTINSRSRELFYWSAVVATFAVGTAVGDLFAVTLNLGYAGSLFLFAALICLPAAYALVAPARHGVATFWCAYVLTRPLGASAADWLGKPKAQGGVGVGNGPVALVLAVAIAGLVGLVTVERSRTKTAIPARPVPPH